MDADAKPTALELMKQLRILIEADPANADKPIELEGCDCIGTWSGEIELKPAAKGLHGKRLYEAYILLKR